MKITIFKLKICGLTRVYSQIEIQEKDIKLLIYSEYFKLVQPKGRPKQIWHEWFIDEYLNYCCTYTKNLKYKILYIKETYPSFFGRNWIEKSEFQNKIWANKHKFIEWDYGS